MRRPLRLCVHVLCLAVAFAWSGPSTLHTRRHTAARAKAPRLELGFQFDPATAIGPVFVLSGYVGLQLKIRQARAARVERDAAAELFRIAKARLLTGEFGVADVERAERAVQQAVVDYDEARLIVALPGALLRIPDPSAREEPISSEGEVEQVQQLQQSEQAQQAQQQAELERVRSQLRKDLEAAPPAAQNADPLYGVRSMLGLQDPDAPPQACG